KTWWIRYSWRGKEYRESAETDSESKARKLLIAKLRTVGTSKHVEAKDQRYTLDDMLEKIKLRYQKRAQRSFINVERAWKEIDSEDGFRFYRVVDIDKDAIEKYQGERLESGAAPATINREVAYLKLGIKLLGLPVPSVEQLAEDNIRQGFLRVPEFNALLDEIADPD